MMDSLPKTAVFFLLQKRNGYKCALIKRFFGGFCNHFFKDLFQRVFSHLAGCENSFDYKMVKVASRFPFELKVI